MSKNTDTTRYEANRQAEVDAAHLYRTLSAIEENPKVAEIFERMARVEEHHADFWAQHLTDAGHAPGPAHPSWRSRTMAWLARRFGPGFVLPTAASVEKTASQEYVAQRETHGTSLAADERSHQRVLQAMSGTGAGLEGGAVARLEGRHRAVGGNALRAAVLGANDGLVSNLSLVMGVAGAALPNKSILITGLAGLLAGAGSMAMGEWLSVQSSRELYERQIAIEAEELRLSPDEEAEELSLIYQAKGLSEEQARTLAQRLIADEGTALDTLAREELGIDPDELGGSAWEAAITSFVLFAIGAIVPVSPFMFLSGMAAVATSLAVSALALFLIGAAITLLTGRSVLYSGTRQLLFGLVASALTFGIGRLIGVSLGG